ncbi:MAG: YqgE/AlgH family protein [Pseudomonadales bacterium]|jgi:putative transcriptional regulator|nr:YqgE/AlgH family protein [Pseudomonadales bacterium]
METCLRHHFLLAMPGLAGSYFGETITYLCEHNEDGAFGLTVNRPLADVVLGDLLEQLEIEGPSHRTAPVLEGGPVQRDRGFVLHTDDVVVDASLRLPDGLALTTAREILVAIADGEGPEQFLVCVGYAGWGAGQLDAEMGENAWLSCPARREILFEVPFEQRIDRAAATLGIDFRLMSGEAGHA